MSVFFFDCFDGRAHHADVLGDDFRSEAEAAEQADAIAYALLSDDLTRGSKDTVWVSVRSAAGGTVYSARLSLSRNWAEGARPGLAEPEKRSA